MRVHDGTQVTANVMVRDLELTDYGARGNLERQIHAVHTASTIATSWASSHKKAIEVSQLVDVWFSTIARRPFPRAGPAGALLFWTARRRGLAPCSRRAGLEVDDGSIDEQNLPNAPISPLAGA
jgi:hypothetical protein